MEMHRHVRAALALGLFFAVQAAAGQDQLDWQPWSDAVFARAKQEGRFVLLDLGAGWCHWCHVMDEITYRDPEVMRLIRSRYVPVRVDQDARPDLSNRYEDYGWPATIVFDAAGKEIVKRRGYIPPRPMASMLQAIIDDPSPGPSVLPEPELRSSAAPILPAETRASLRQLLVDAYDRKNRGWGTIHKFLDWDVVEYSMMEALRGDRTFEQMARETLDGQLRLMDPVWGGVYQYSTDGDWDHPHYEKIMQMQAENLRIYAQAYAIWKDESYLRTARQIRDYLKAFLTDCSGAFYTSQDADLNPGEHSAGYFSLSDAERRKIGIPRVDRSIYARENGWAIASLAALYGVTGETEYLTDAIRAADWVITNRELPAGGFRHGANDAAGPYLGDTLYLGRAFLALYGVTADRIWLGRAEQAANFIWATYRQGIGFNSAAGSEIVASRPQFDENVNVVRFANLLHQYTGRSAYRQIAEHAMRYLAGSDIANRRGFQVGGVLLADVELASAPLHVTVVGRKNDEAARDLFLAGIRQPATYKRIEWWDSREGGLPNPDVEYPELERAAAFVCADRACSAPIFQADQLAAKIGGR